MLVWSNQDEEANDDLWKAAMAIVRSFPQAPTCCESVSLTSRPFRSPKGGMSFIMNHQMALNPDVDPSTAQIFVP
jgi:hypothetical protein